MEKWWKIICCAFVSPAWLAISAASPTVSAQTRQPMAIEEIVSSQLSCEQCHEKTTPRIFQEHTNGVHAREGVGCAGCHGTDHRGFKTATARSACEQCHPKETAEFLASGHGKSWVGMAASARYQKQPELVRRQGCEACHRIGVGDNDGRCDFCHTKHSFSKAEAAAPASCYTCHMGPDHPQMEAYRKSGHHFTPATCVSCHMPGTHNASLNLNRLGSEDIGAECSKCHDQAFNRKWLDGAAMLEAQGKELLAVARRIIERLNDRGLLYPAPPQREPNPVEGKVLVLGGHQLYEDTSRAEKLYFEMQKYQYMHLTQGAFHQDFKMAAYEGLIPLQKHLSELQAEVVLLEELAAKKETLSAIAPPASGPAPAPLYHATYESSFHGVLPEQRNKPACITCHPADSAAAGNWPRICGACHTTAQTGQFSRDLAGIKQYSQNLRQQADKIIDELITCKIAGRDDDGRLRLRAGFSRGRQQAAEMLLKRLSLALIDLDQSLAMMELGVGHSNPDYCHWYGNAAAKSDLIEIRDAVHKLRVIQELEQAANRPLS